MQMLHYLEAFLCPHCFAPLLFVGIAIVALKIGTENTTSCSSLATKDDPDRPQMVSALNSIC